MRILNTLEPSAEKTAVALGFFDGVHLGHRAVLGAAVECGKKGLVPAAFTFTETPKKGDENLRLMTKNQKLSMLEKLGIETLYMINFETVKNLSPEQFVKDIIGGVFRAKKVFCGFNYRFGKGGAGDSEKLVSLCREIGAEATVLPAVNFDGETVSSTLIRSLLKDGNLRQANRLLGYAFTVEGKTVRGSRVGTSMSTPTMNLELEAGVIVPKFGGYASVVELDGKSFAGVTNIGVKPTVSSRGIPNCETWMPSFTGGDLYGKEVRIHLKDFIRPEKKFDNIAQLEAAIKADSQAAQKILAEE